MLLLFGEAVIILWFGIIMIKITEMTVTTDLLNTILSANISWLLPIKTDIILLFDGV